MPTNCSVRGCAGTGVNKSYFTLPAVFKFKQCPAEKAELSKQRRQLWLEALGLRDDDSAIKIRVCSDHFLTGRPAALDDSNSIDWVPSLHMHLPTILSNRQRKIIPEEQPTTRRVASKNVRRNYGFRRGEPRKILNCKVLLDGNLRCTSFKGTNGSGLAIIQKHGKFTSDNITLRETAINNTVLRVRLLQEDLHYLKRKYTISDSQKRRDIPTLKRKVNRKSSTYEFDPDYSTASDEASYDETPYDEAPFEEVPEIRQKHRLVKQGTHNTSNRIQNINVNVRMEPYSKLQRRLMESKQSPGNTKTLNRVIKKNDNDKIRVKFFPKTSTPMRNIVKNGTIQNISDSSINTHREMYINQYKNPLVVMPTLAPILEPERTYYLKFGITRTLQESMLDYPFQKLVMDVKHMKLPGPSWKIKVIIRQGKIAALTFTNKLPLERAVSFTATSNKFNIVVENRAVLLLGSPLTVRCAEDLETLLEIVDTIDPKSCMLLYKKS